jgi:hypothetical protein
MPKKVGNTSTEKKSGRRKTLLLRKMYPECNFTRQIFKDYKGKKSPSQIAPDSVMEDLEKLEINRGDLDDKLLS